MRVFPVYVECAIEEVGDVLKFNICCAPCLRDMDEPKVVVGSSKPAGAIEGVTRCQISMSDSVSTPMEVTGRFRRVEVSYSKQELNVIVDG
jgi:hypothetical protein